MGANTDGDADDNNDDDFLLPRSLIDADEDDKELVLVAGDIGLLPFLTGEDFFLILFLLI